MSRRPFELVSLLWALGALGAIGGGCSALVTPDPSRLGSSDAGARDTGGGTIDANVDGGPPFDGGPHDAGSDDVGPRDGGTDAAVICSGPGDCDDGFACTIDQCNDNDCDHVADDAACEDGERCNPVTGCVPEVCTTGADCDDGDACNGVETCGGAGADPVTNCVAGTPPRCDDGVSCTDDACDDEVGCVYARHDERCDDGVSCTADSCAATAGPSGCQHLPDSTICNGACTTGSVCTPGGCMGGGARDCGDANPCTADSCDPSAPGACVHRAIDADGDTYPAAMVSGTSCAGGTDCADGNPAVHPGAAEVCANGIDDNCAGGIDEGCAILGEDCTSPIAIVLGAPSATGVRTGSATGNNSTLRDDYATACTGTGTGGRDAVYYVDLEAGGDVIVDTIGATFDSVLAVGTTCSGTGLSAQCNDDMDPGSTGPLVSRIFLHNLSVTGSLRLFILVDGFGTASGSYTVTVRQRSAGSDSCSSGEPLDITGGGTVFGAIAPLAGITGSVGTCQDAVTEGAEGEALFRIGIPSDRTIAGLDAVALSGGFNPDIYLRDGSCAGPQRGCIHGSDATTSFSNVMYPAGTSPSRAVFFLDGMRGAGATYSLDYDP
jgi:hypothetical protein